ncbi:hypothetical protein K2W90_01180 [Candidatus Babeliales bacterium]|nr:hypothetical protein [Candidatus Babeliales bacterium]
MTPFFDRHDAGKKLAHALHEYKDVANALVLGLPRGGVEVAAVVAAELNAPLDIVVSRKIGAPGNPELAVGAVSQDGKTFIDDATVDLLSISKETLAELTATEKKEAEQRVETYRADLPEQDFTGKTVIVVDDGIATGFTMLAALATVKKLGAVQVIAAVPVASQDALAQLKRTADHVVVLHTPDHFTAISTYYHKFPQVSDAQVIAILHPTPEEI